MEQIERITQMEHLFDFSLEAMKNLQMEANLYARLKEAVTTLSAYYSSNEWRRDYEADETSLLPKDLKRGVLSEDGLWNLLSEWQELERKFLQAE